MKLKTKGVSIILHVIFITSLTEGIILSIINVLSGSNNISSSSKKLNNVISYPHTAPVKVNIVPSFNG